MGIFLSLGLGRDPIQLRLAGKDNSREVLALRHLGDCTKRTDGSNVRASEFHESYCTWVRTESCGAATPMTLTVFGRWLIWKQGGNMRVFAKPKINDVWLRHFLT